ncbi:hemolysin family protein [Opitutales bacterium]|nr:hemolysin family protein [Opitutales bacterium]
MITASTIQLASLVAVLIGLKAVFVMTEFSLIRLRFSHFNSELLEELQKARRMSGLLDGTDRVLRFLRLGATVVTLFLGLVLVPFTKQVGLTLSVGETTGSWLVLYVVVFSSAITLHYVLGHLLPRGIALQHPAGVLKATSWLIWFLVGAFSPVQKIFDMISRGLLRLFGMDPKVSLNKLDLETQIKNLDEQTEIPEFTQRVFKNVISMRDLVVQDVLLPRNQLQFFDLQDGNEVNFRLSKTAGHTRFPLCEGDLDNCIGIMHIKDLYCSEDEILEMDFRKLARPVVYVGADDPLETVLERLLELRIHMALVRDDFGGTVGAITMENIVEELVGNIQDEFDSETEQIEEVQEDVFIVDGLTPIHDVEEKLDMEIDEEEVSTIGGLITSELGKIPDAGQTIRVKNLEIEAVVVDQKRVLTARVKVIQSSEED